MPRHPDLSPEALPAPVLAQLVAARTLGFSGARNPQPRALARLRSALAFAPGRTVLVGCASGIDAAVRRACPFALVYRAGSGAPYLLARRSALLVHQLHTLGGVLVAFPSGPCPSALAPSPSWGACFAGYGSGTWATVALASGLGCGVLVWLPPACGAPAWLAPLGGGWFGPASPAQLSLL